MKQLQGWNGLYLASNHGCRDQRAPSHAYMRAVFKAYVELLEETGVANYDDSLLEALAASMHYEASQIMEEDGLATSATVSVEGRGGGCDPTQKASFAHSTLQHPGSS